MAVLKQWRHSTHELETRVLAPKIRDSAFFAGDDAEGVCGLVVLEREAGAVVFLRPAESIVAVGDDGGRTSGLRWCYRSMRLC